MQKLDNKVALITGGSKGIGLGIARALVEKNMRVAITSRSQQGADEAVALLKQAGKGDVMGFACDVRDAGAQQQVVEKIVQAWGGLDVLVANAGVGHFGPIEDMTAEQWLDTIGINLTGVFYSIKAAIPALKNSKGYFITIGSLAGTNFFEGGTAYNASKFGLVGFTQAAMLDLRRYGIRTSTIMPGSVATHFNGRTPGAADAWKIQPEDIGELVADLLEMNPRTLPSKIEVRPSMPSK